MKTLLALAFALAASALQGAAQAQTYPSKPIRIIVPFTPGGAVDVLARMVASKMQDALGQPVVVEMRPGAGGSIGADAVAKSPPDGYTILQHTNGQAITPALYRSLPFDTMKDFIPVTQLVNTYTVLVANPKLPANSARELIALARSKPGQLNYGTAGVGTSLHLTMEMLKREAGINIQAIPYRGDLPLATALITGEVDVAIVPLATALPQIEAGRMKALAVSSGKRAAMLPNVPSIAEDAVAGFDAAGWQGFFVAAHTPPAIVATIQREAAKAVHAPDIAARIRTMGNEPVGSTTADFTAKFTEDVAKFAKVVREANIPAQD